jgi:hypothetical protein
MWLLRLLAILIAIAIVLGFAAGVLTGDRRYLQMSLKLLRFGVLFALIVFGLLILERLAVIPF